jgi:hypothetical protein
MGNSCCMEVRISPQARPQNLVFYSLALESKQESFGHTELLNIGDKKRIHRLELEARGDPASEPGIEVGQCTGLR